jgi:hypothetical protein
MTRSPNRVVASILILLNLAFTVGPHIHADEALNLGGTATLRSHDCGAHEIHKDIKERGDCLLCSRTTNFVAFVVYGPVPVNHAVALFVLPALESSPKHSTSSPFFLRGPPLS